MPHFSLALLYSVRLLRFGSAMHSSLSRATLSFNLLGLYSHWFSPFFILSRLYFFHSPQVLVNARTMHVSIEDVAYGVKLLTAGCTNFGPRGDHKANETLNFH